MRKFSLTRRQMLVVAHDLFATAAAVVVSFYVRFEAAGWESRLDGLMPILPGFVLWAGCVYFLSGLYFPIRSLGALGAVAAGILPLTLGTDAIRQVLLGPDAHRRQGLACRRRLQRRGRRA